MWDEQKEREPEDSWLSTQATNPAEPPVRAQVLTKVPFLIQAGSWDFPNGW